MSYSLSLFAGAGWQFFDNNGTILSGGKLYTYSAGSTSPLTTYTSSSGGTLNPNPIILDSAGRVPAEVWVNSSSIAKFVLKTSADVLIGTWDNIPSLVSSLNLTGTNNGVVYFNSVGTFTSGTNLTFDGANLGVAGAATIGSNLNVAGPSALTGNVTASGNLSVTGNTTLNSTLTTYDNVSLGGTLSVTGNVINTMNITGTLTTSGTTTLATGTTITASPSTSDNTTKAATTAFVKAAMLGSPSQTWQVFYYNTTSGSILGPGGRAYSTVYTNSTDRPIMVNVEGGSAAVIRGYVGSGGTATDIVAICDSTSASYPFISFIVPVGWGYKVTASSGSVNAWAELR